MRNIFVALEGGSIDSQRKKRTTICAIIATAAALAVSLLAFLVTGVFSLLDDAFEAKPSKDKNNTVGYVVTTLTEEQRKSGNLLLLDDDHPYRGSNIIMLIADAANRSKTAGGSWAYTIGGTTTLGGTEEAITAFNNMISAYYASDASGGDDNIYINSAHHNASTSQSEIYRSGLCFGLTYYEDYYADSTKRPSIYGVEKYAWIYQNAHKYGFIQLFPAISAGGNVDTTNANIFRYVGVPHATYIKEQNITLAQYLEFIKTKTADAPLTITASDASYNIYHIAEGAEARVPSEQSYEVSGDNMGGYIITVKVS
jgi:D-alanyl-D-alanine carboxypeptidase